MINYIKQIVKRIILKLPKKYILMESKPDYADNTMAVYNYIMENKLNKKFNPVWIVDDEKNRNKKIKTLILNRNKNNTLKWRYYFLRCAAMIYCNAQIQKTQENQKSIFLTHGSMVKDTVGTYKLPHDLDYILIQSDMFKETARRSYSLSDHTKIITLGYPRNDDLLLPNKFNREEIFGRKVNKLIVWYPTFRQNKNDGRNVSPNALPIIHDADLAKKINEKAKELDVLIVLKPHFAQNIEYIKNESLSNIIIIDDEFLKSKCIRSYQLLNLSDALLSDYSSVYQDYLLCDKPIGLIWEDFEEYKKGQGFVIDPEIAYMGGEKIYTSDDLETFIENVATGKDVLRDARRKSNEMSNFYQDANSSKRVVEFILELITKR